MRGKPGAKGDVVEAAVLEVEAVQSGQGAAQAQPITHRNVSVTQEGAREMERDRQVVPAQPPDHGPARTRSDNRNVERLRGNHTVCSPDPVEKAQIRVTAGEKDMLAVIHGDAVT